MAHKERTRKRGPQQPDKYSQKPGPRYEYWGEQTEYGYGYNPITDTYFILPDAEDQVLEDNDIEVPKDKKPPSSSERYTAIVVGGVVTVVTYQVANDLIKSEAGKDPVSSGIVGWTKKRVKEFVDSFISSHGEEQVLQNSQTFTDNGVGSVQPGAESEIAVDGALETGEIVSEPVADATPGVAAPSTPSTPSTTPGAPSDAPFHQPGGDPSASSGPFNAPGNAPAAPGFGEVGGSIGPPQGPFLQPGGDPSLPATSAQAGGGGAAPSVGIGTVAQGVIGAVTLGQLLYHSQRGNYMGATIQGASGGLALGTAAGTVAGTIAGDAAAGSSFGPWGAAAGAALGIGLAFQGGKSRGQAGRDGYRNHLTEMGIAQMGENGSHQIVLADGTTYDIGRDGKNATETGYDGEQYHLAYEVDLSNPNSELAISLINPLFGSATGFTKSRGSDHIAALINGIMSNAGDDPAVIIANAKKLYEAAEVSQEQIYDLVMEGYARGTITKEEAQAYQAGVNQVFGETFHVSEERATEIEQGIVDSGGFLDNKIGGDNGITTESVSELRKQELINSLIPNLPEGNFQVVKLSTPIGAVDPVTKRRKTVKDLLREMRIPQDRIDQLFPDGVIDVSGGIVETAPVEEGPEFPVEGEEHLPEEGMPEEPPPVEEPPLAEGGLGEVPEGLNPKMAAKPQAAQGLLHGIGEVMAPDGGPEAPPPEGEPNPNFDAQNIQEDGITAAQKYAEEVAAGSATRQSLQPGQPTPQGPTPYQDYLKDPQGQDYFNKNPQGGLLHGLGGQPPNPNFIQGISPERLKQLREALQNNPQYQQMVGLAPTNTGTNFK